MKPSQVKIGVNIFIVKDNKILFGKRIGKVGNGTWCLPGGHFEYGESLVEAAKRELREETGIEVDTLEFLHIINDILPEQHYVHINFIANGISGDPMVAEPDKFEIWKWFDFDNLPEKIFVGHKKFISTFLEKVNFKD